MDKITATAPVDGCEQCEAVGHACIECYMDL